MQNEMTQPSLYRALDDRPAVSRREVSPAFDGNEGFAFILGYTPLLWLAGLLPFCTPLMLVVSFIRQCCWKHLKDPAVSGWFLIAASQMLSTSLAWSETAEGVGQLFYRFLSAPVSGWIFLGMLVAVGKELKLGSDRLSRAVAMLGLYILVLGAPLLIVGRYSGITDLEWLTPIGHLIPSSLPSAQFEFTAQFLIPDDFVGQTMPRLVLFYPWPTCLGFAGATIFFICLTRKRGFLTYAGASGGAFATLASTSRAAVLGTLIGVVVYAILRLPQGKRPFVVLGIITTLLVCLCLPMAFLTDPLTLIQETAQSVSGLRQDSSDAREQLYAETRRQIAKYPYLGHGWQGDILEDTIPLNIGSHSTIYGLLYTGGVLTLVPFVLTALIAGSKIFSNAVRGSNREQAALSIFIVLMVMCFGECIYSFAIPVFFSFLWIGSCLGARTTELSTEIVSSKEYPKRYGARLGSACYLQIEHETQR